MELPIFAILQRKSKVAVPLVLALFLLTIVPALYSLLATPSISSSWTENTHLMPKISPNPAPPRHQTSSSSQNHSSTLITLSTSRKHIRDDEGSCDLFSGEWVRNEEAPYYTNTTCRQIQEHQNCMKNGRPDTDFMKWRWKPDSCDLPVFDPHEFLEMVRGKAMGFVGDSISRNQLQSLLCLLSTVEYPQDISPSSVPSIRVWIYKSYNFTVQTMWSPYLVKTTEPNDTSPSDPNSNNIFSVYLDEYDTMWTSQINQMDFLVISSAHWWARPLIFYENHIISGCQYCSLPNTTKLTSHYAYKKALRTSLRAILDNFKGLAFLRTFSPRHFEGGPWNKGGDCVRTRPYRRNETIPGSADLKLHQIQLEEFRAAQEEVKKKKSLRLRLMDTTQAMLLRPDGHPGRYGHPKNTKVNTRNDCVHWCLPGPIDIWNDILLQMMKLDKSIQSAS